MKRLLAVIMVLALLLCGCSSGGGGILTSLDTPANNLDTNPRIYPTYENLNTQEKAIWEEIRAALAEHKTDRIVVGAYKSETLRDLAKDRMNHFMRELAYTYPDYFWINLSSFKYFMTTTALGYYELSIEPGYIMDAEEAQQKKPAYDNAVNTIVEAAKEFDDPFEKVLYVYDTIMAGASYDHDLAASDESAELGRSAYGCLVDGKTVCSGYALAFRSIMEKLGIECGVEFNSYSSYVLSKDGHVWNYCKLDDEYYYFDLTWDDTGFDSEDYADVLPYSHLYFGINAEELAASTYDIDPDAPIPECTGTKYNYFVYKGLSFPEYDYETVKPVIQQNSSEKFVTLRFDSYYELEQAKIDLIDNQKIFEVLPDLETLSYITCKTDHHLMLIF